MKKCERGCTYCQGDQCEIRTEKCYLCGEEKKVSEMFVIYGERFCFGCYLKRGERFGKV